MKSLNFLLAAILAVVNLTQKSFQSAIAFLAQASVDHQSLARSIELTRTDQAAGFSRTEKLLGEVKALIGDPNTDAESPASPELTELADHLETQAEKLRAVVDQFETFVNQNPGAQPVK